jgi:serine phosphatase RsbU (regulator of sigma subunit)
MFTTAFVGYLDLGSGRLQFASAGHNPPLLYRASTGHCERLEAPGVAMGLFENATFAKRGAKLTEGDILALYTDGVTEAANAQEQEFGLERLEKLIIEQADRPAQALAEQIVNAVADFAADAIGIFDDETLIVIKREHGG